MIKRVVWTIVALLIVAGIVFGAYYLHQRLTGGDMPFAAGSVTATSTPVPNVTENVFAVDQDVASTEIKVTEAPTKETPKVTEAPAKETPKVTEVPTKETPKVTEAPAKETPKVTEVPAKETPKVTEAPTKETPKVTEAPAKETPKVTEAPAKETPKVTEAPTKETPKSTETPKRPELVTDTSSKVNEEVVENENSVTNKTVRLLVDNYGKIFAITEKRRDSVEKVVVVNNFATILQLQNGRLKYFAEAWRSEEKYIVGNVIEYEVKLDKVFTTVEEALAKTVMKDKNGYAHRLFDESKPGKLVVRIKFEFNNKTYLIEVWIQGELFTLRKLGEVKVEVPVTSTPAPSHNPDLTPTPTPPAPSHNPDPTPTPTLPAPSHNPDPTPTPTLPAPSHNPDNNNSNTGNPNHNNDSNNATQSTPTVNENGDTLVEPGLLLPPK